MLKIKSQSSTTASRQGTRRQNRQSNRNNDVREKMRLVVGNLETVVAELKTVVVDLRVLVHQIDLVTDKLDQRFGLNWREPESLSEDEGSVSATTIRNSCCSQTDDHIGVTCDSFQLRRLLYLPETAADRPGKMKGLCNGYSLTADIISECYKAKHLPILDCNQNEAFAKDFMESSSSNGGSEFLSQTFTSGDYSFGGTAELDLLVRQTQPVKPNEAFCDYDCYSGIYEAELDEKLENYLSFVDSFDSSDDEDCNESSEGFNIVSTLPDATDAKTRYTMVSSWAECAMYNLATHNLTSDGSETSPGDSPALPMDESRPKSSIGELSLASEVALFQNEVTPEVPQYRSVLVF